MNDDYRVIKLKIPREEIKRLMYEMTEKCGKHPLNPEFQDEYIDLYCGGVLAAAFGMMGPTGQVVAKLMRDLNTDESPSDHRGSEQS